MILFSTLAQKVGLDGKAGRPRRYRENTPAVAYPAVIQRTDEQADKKLNKRRRTHVASRESAALHGPVRYIWLKFALMR